MAHLLANAEQADRTAFRGFVAAYGASLSNPSPACGRGWVRVFLFLQIRQEEKKTFTLPLRGALPLPQAGEGNSA